MLKLNVFVLVFLLLTAIHESLANRCSQGDTTDFDASWALDVMFLIERSAKTSSDIWASVGSPLELIRDRLKHRKNMRLSIASTSSSECYKLHMPLGDPNAILGPYWDTIEDSLLNGVGLAAQGMLVGFQDSNVGWDPSPKEKKLKLTVALVASPPANVDPDQPEFNNNCLQSPPSRIQAGDLMGNKHNVASIIMVQGDDTLVEQWTDFVNPHKGGMGSVVRKVVTTTFPALVEDAINEVICKAPILLSCGRDDSNFEVGFLLGGGNPGYWRDQSQKYLWGLYVEQDFNNAVAMIESWGKRSRFALASSSNECYKLHRELKAGRNIPWLDAAKPNGPDFEALVQGALVMLEDPPVDWALGRHENYRFIVAFIDDEHIVVHPQAVRRALQASCSQLSYNPAVPGKLLRQLNAGLLILIKSANPYRLAHMTDYAKRMEAPVVVRHAIPTDNETLSNILISGLSELRCLLPALPTTSTTTTTTTTTMSTLPTTSTTASEKNTVLLGAVVIGSALASIAAGGVALAGTANMFNGGGTIEADVPISAEAEVPEQVVEREAFEDVTIDHFS